MTKIRLYMRRANRVLSATWSQIVSWRERHIREKTFIIILALLIGVFGGLAALLLKSLIHLIQHLLTVHLSLTGGN